LEIAVKNGDAPPLMDIFEIKGIGAWLAPKNRADMLRTALLGALILSITKAHIATYTIMQYLLFNV